MNKKVAAPGLENRDYTAVGTRCADHVTPLYPQKLALTSPTGGGRSVGIVRSRTKATEFSLVYMYVESGYNVVWVSMRIVLRGGPPSYTILARSCVSL